MREFEGHTRKGWSVAWSVDELRALSGASDGTMRLWDVETGRCLRVFESHQLTVWSEVWSANGAYERSRFAPDAARQGER